MARALALAAAVGQLVFVTSWIVGGALAGRYSAWSQGVSELGLRHAAHGWIVNAGLVVFGFSFIALAVALTFVLSRRPAGHVAVVLFLTTGIALAVAGLLPMDCGFSTYACRTRFYAGALSWQTTAHVSLAFVGSLALLGTPFAITRVLWPGPAALVALAAAAFGLLVGVAGQLAALASAPQGITERLELLAGQAWVLLVSGGILYVTRRRVKTAPLTPLRSREMFATSWRGEGTFTPWPPLLGRLVRVRFTLSRVATFLSEEMWTFDDCALLAGGGVLTQRLICTLEPTGRIRVTSDNVPGGCEVLLDDNGYRLTPYRYLVLVGPLRFTLRCREEHRVQTDGSLLGTLKARWLGLPIGVLRWRATRSDRRHEGVSPDQDSIGVPPW